MSQYPSPYQPPQYQPQYSYYPPNPDASAPARQAGLLIMILGGIALVFSGCLIAAANLPEFMDKLPPEQRQAFEQVEAATSVSAKAWIIGFGIAAIVFSAFYISIGAFVRRGSLAWSITGIVFTVILLLYWLLNAAVAIFQGVPGLIGGCFSLLMVGLFGWIFVLLLQSARSSGKSSSAQVQSQQQYMAYMQAMQQYGQAGYGYGYGSPAAPRPPAPPAPPPSQSEQNPPDASA